MRGEVAVIPYPAWNGFAHTFAHLVAGRYAAGYYSYLLAEALPADAWDAFSSPGVLHQPTWDSFRREGLVVGGSRSAIENVVAFRGRLPSPAALLRQRGQARMPDARRERTQH